MTCSGPGRVPGVRHGQALHKPGHVLGHQHQDGVVFQAKQPLHAGQTLGKAGRGLGAGQGPGVEGRRPRGREQALDAFSHGEKEVKQP